MPSTFLVECLTVVLFHLKDTDLFYDNPGSKLPLQPCKVGGEMEEVSASMEGLPPMEENNDAEDSVSERESWRDMGLQYSVRSCAKFDNERLHPVVFKTVDSLSEPLLDRQGKLKIGRMSIPDVVCDWFPLTEFVLQVSRATLILLQPRYAHVFMKRVSTALIQISTNIIPGVENSRLSGMKKYFTHTSVPFYMKL